MAYGRLGDDKAKIRYPRMIRYMLRRGEHTQAILGYRMIQWINVRKYVNRIRTDAWRSIVYE